MQNLDLFNFCTKIFLWNTRKCFNCKIKV